MATMRRTVLAIAAVLIATLGITTSAADASTPRAVTTPAAQARPGLDAGFAALAATLPVCRQDQPTNCRTGTAAHLLASVQSKTATIYFEMRNGAVTVFEVYPVAR